MIGMRGLGMAQDWGAFFSPAGNGMMLLLIFAGLLIVYLWPNTEQIMDKVTPALEWEKWRSVDPARLRFSFRFTPLGVVFASLALFLGFAFISRGTANFIYFKF